MIWTTRSKPTVLVTRSAEAGAPFRALLESHGIRTIDLPTIEICDPSSWEDCDRAIHHLDDYHGVFFTSRNAVDFLLKRIHEIDPKQIRALTSLRLFAVGDKTDGHLHDAGLFSAIVPRSSSADDLASMLTRAGVWQKRYLFPKSSIARETLPDHIRSMGGIVDEVVVYENRVPAAATVQPVRTALLSGQVDVATFFSPSSIHNAVELLGRDALAKTMIAVIGPTTANAVRDVGLTPKIIAKRATAESFAEDILEKLKL